MDASISGEQSLENYWRRRVREAGLRVEFARSYLTEIENDLRSGAKARQDCEEEYRHALGAKLAAVEEYHRVLKIFRDLVVEQKIPDENEDRASKGKSAP